MYTFAILLHFYIFDDLGPKLGLILDYNGQIFVKIWININGCAMDNTLCSTTFKLYHPNFFSKHSIYVKDNPYLSFSSKYIGYQKLDLWGFIT